MAPENNTSFNPFLESGLDSYEVVILYERCLSGRMDQSSSQHDNGYGCQIVQILRADMRDPQILSLSTPSTRWHQHVKGASKSVFVGFEATGYAVFDHPHACRVRLRVPVFRSVGANEFRFQ